MAVSSYGWEGNRKSGIASEMRQRLYWSNHLRLKAYDSEISTPSTLLYVSITNSLVPLAFIPTRTAINKCTKFSTVGLLCCYISSLSTYTQKPKISASGLKYDELEHVSRQASFFNEFFTYQRRRTKSPTYSDLRPPPGLFSGTSFRSPKRQLAVRCASPTCSWLKQRTLELQLRS